MKLRKTIKYWIQIIFYNLYSNYLNNFNIFLGATLFFSNPYWFNQKSNLRHPVLTRSLGKVSQFNGWRTSMELQ